jgi:hypothetical protein
MENERLNMSLRSFLKQLGVSSQQEIEKAVRQSGKTSGSVTIIATVKSEAIGLKHVVEGKIDLG